MTTNRIQDCWELVFQDTGEIVGHATPIDAAVSMAKEDRKSTGRHVLIRPNVPEATP
jgi:hypothetical protein